MAIALFIYALGFFAIAPIRMLVGGGQVWFGTHLSEKVYNTLYWSWVEDVSQENIIRRAWNSNLLYWCENIESCTVEK